MITLAWEVADEVFCVSGMPCRMEEVYSDIRSDTDSYEENGRIILSGLNLIRKELNKRKTTVTHPKVSQSCSIIISAIEKVEKLLKESGVDNSKLEKMMSLEFLLDHSRIHRCHQHYIKDMLWNLADSNAIYW